MFWLQVAWHILSYLLPKQSRLRRTALWQKNKLYTASQSNSKEVEDVDTTETCWTHFACSNVLLEGNCATTPCFCLKECAKKFNFTVHPADYGSPARSRHQQIEEEAVDDKHEHHNDLNCFELHDGATSLGSPNHGTHPRRKQRLRLLQIYTMFFFCIFLRYQQQTSNVRLSSMTAWLSKSWNLV